MAPTYTTEGETSWMGVFVNHKSLSRMKTLASTLVHRHFGGIQGTLTSVFAIHASDEYDTYDVRYANNRWDTSALASDPSQSKASKLDLTLAS